MKWKCPKCGTEITPEGIIIAEDSARCKNISPTLKLRCQRRKGHTSNHYHYPFVWAQSKVLGPTEWEEDEKVIVNGMK